MTETEFKDSLNHRCKEFAERAKGKWTQQIDFLDAVLLAIKPTDFEAFIRARIGQKTPRNEFLFLDAAMKLTAYYKYYLMVLVSYPSSSWDDLSPVVVKSLGQAAANFDDAIGQLDRYLQDGH